MKSNFDDTPINPESTARPSAKSETARSGVNSEINAAEARSEDTHLMRDRFELISAYLDGEVTASERRLVEQWLATDAKSQQLYQRLLKLRQGMRSLVVPVSVPTEQTVQQVMTRLNRRPSRRIAWGGAAAAAMVLAVVSPILFQGVESSVQHAHNHRSASETAPVASAAPTYPTTAISSDEGLMISLANPVVDIPAVSGDRSETRKNLSDADNPIR